MARRNKGNEAFERLLDWKSDQAASERLSSQILRIEGFQFLDPSHPLGGKDGTRDIVCTRNGKKWICAVYFPRGQKTIAVILKKFKHDIQTAIAENNAGFIFVTNQELRLSERDKLVKSAGSIAVEIYHLERISSIMNAPECYGIRLEFLDIEMTKDEQIAFIASRERNMLLLTQTIDSLYQKIESVSQITSNDLGGSIPLSKLQEFKNILDTITVNPQYTSASLDSSPFWRRYGIVSDLHVPLFELREFQRILDIITVDPQFSSTSILSTPTFRKYGIVRDLHVPLMEIKEFAKILESITGRYQPSVQTSYPIHAISSQNAHVDKLQVPLFELRQFEELLNKICGIGESNSYRMSQQGIPQSTQIRKLQVPLQELKEYESVLDRVIEKLKALPRHLPAQTKMIE